MKTPPDERMDINAFTFCRETIGSNCHRVKVLLNKSRVPRPSPSNHGNKTKVMLAVFIFDMVKLVFSIDESVLIVTPIIVYAIMLNIH